MVQNGYRKHRVRIDKAWIVYVRDSKEPEVDEVQGKFLGQLINEFEGYVVEFFGQASQ